MKSFLQRRAGIAARSVQLTDNDERRVVVLNRPLALRVGNGRAGNIRKIHEERFIRFNERVAVNRNVEGVARVAGGDRLPGQTLRNVVVVFGSRIVVLRRAVGGGDVKSDAASGRRQRRIDGERKRRAATVAFALRNIGDGQRRTVVIQNCALALAVGDRCAGNIS